MTAHGIAHTRVQLGHRLCLSDDRLPQSSRAEALLGRLLDDEDDLAHFSGGANADDSTSRTPTSQAVSSAKALFESLAIN